MESLRQAFGWLVDSAAYPKLFVAFFFLFLGFVVIPFCLRAISWRGEWGQFRARQSVVFDENKSKFHSLANQAYRAWVFTHRPRNFIQTLDKLIANCKAPANRDFTSGRVDKIENVLKVANPDLWDFCCSLYGEIERVNRNKDYEPSLLTRSECENFSTYRRRLTNFWDMEGEKILDGVGIVFRYIWMRKIRIQLQESSMRLLPYLETALAKELESERLGAIHLFKLSKMGFQ